MLEVRQNLMGCTIAGRWTHDNIRIDNEQPPLVLEVHGNLMDVLSGTWTHGNMRIDNGKPPLVLEVHQKVMDVL